MASITKNIETAAPVRAVWSAIRDIGALHTRLVPGFVVDTVLDGNARIVTFANGMVIREPIITLDEEHDRLVWSAEGPQFEHYNSSAQAIEQADFVLVSTNSPAAAVQGEWLRPGQAIFGVGRPNEFNDDVYLRAGLITVTSKAHELEYYDRKLDQPLIRLSNQGTIPWDTVIELGDIVAGKIAAPALANSIIVFRDSQGGYGDLALAAWAYEEAKRRGLGQQISTE